MIIWPASQVATSGSSDRNVPPTAPASPTPQSDGRIAGIDGVLDQIAGAVTRQVVPIVRDTVLPIIQRDKELQKTVGEAIGRGAVRSLRPFLWVIAGSVAVIAYAYWKSKNVDRGSEPQLRSKRS